MAYRVNLCDRMSDVHWQGSVWGNRLVRMWMVRWTEFTLQLVPDRRL